MRGCELRQSKAKNIKAASSKNGFHSSISCCKKSTFRLPKSIPKNMFSIHRKILILLSLTILLSPKSFAEILATAPCYFPFDASHAKVSISQEFAVKEHRQYKFTLNFLHKGGENALNLLELLDSQDALILTDSLVSEHPIKIRNEYFLKKKIFSSPDEKNQALTDANIKYDEAVRAAISARLKGEKHEFSYLAQNTKGLTPLRLTLEKSDGDMGYTRIFIRELPTNGIDSGGGGKLVRQIWSAALRPGVKYRITAETIQDTPILFGTEITLGITFDPRLSVLHTP